MPTRRHLVATAVAAGTAAALATAGHAAPALAWKHFPAGPDGFFRAPVLLTGPTRALLIDGGFTYGDGRAVAAAVAATGKALGAIYVTQSDPDYYFSLKPVHEAFPATPILAAPEAVAALQGSVAGKLAAWGPQLGPNGPQAIGDVVVPQAYDGTTLDVDGQGVEVVPAIGLPNRRHLWVPSLRAVFGGVLVFSGVHVWTADNPTREQRMAWIANLDRMAASDPAIVVPGHMAPGAATDRSALAFTRAYLLAFDEELAKARDAATLKAAMEARFPGLGMGVALDIGAKVATGEMKWG